MTRAAPFTQADISKLLKGAKAAGVKLSRVEIDRTGRIVAHLAPEDDNAAPADDEWGARIRAQNQRAAAQRN